MLAMRMLEEAKVTMLASEQNEQNWRRFQMALLKCDFLGVQHYGGAAFRQAANSRFAYSFNYTEHVMDTATRLG